LLVRRQELAAQHFHNIKRENLSLAFGIYKNSGTGEKVDISGNVQGLQLVPITYDTLGPDALTDSSQKVRVDTTAVPPDIAKQMGMKILKRSV